MKFLKLLTFGSLSALVMGISGCNEADKLINTIDDHVQSIADSANENVLGVKSGYPDVLPEITFGDAFGEFFSSPTWNYFKADTGEEVVEFTGYCLRNNEEVKVRLQFILNNENGTFQTGAVSINDLVQSQEESNEIVYSAFKNYAINHNMLIQDSYQDYIWYDENQDLNNANVSTTNQYITSTVTENLSDSNYSDDYYSEEYDDEYLVEDDMYIIPYSDSCYLTEDDLEGLTSEELRLARNEIYARHGRMFLSEDLQEYFDEQSWYEPIYEADEFQEDWLNDYEKTNAYFIKDFEEK